MPDAHVPKSDDEALDDLYPSIAWDRIGLVSEHDFMRRYSVQHRAPLDARRTLCGALIPAYDGLRETMFRAEMFGNEEPLMVAAILRADALASNQTQDGGSNG